MRRRLARRGAGRARRQLDSRSGPTRIVTPGAKGTPGQQLASPHGVARPPEAGGCQRSPWTWSEALGGSESSEVTLSLRPGAAGETHHRVKH
jgi:hypothetical protein